MISTIAKLLGVDDWLVGAIGVFIAAGLVLWVVSAIYDRGYDAATTKYMAQIATEHAALATARTAETERQDAANNAAKEREAARIAEMQAAAQELQTRIEELQREADQDPDARRVAIDAPSVRRINQVR